MISPFRGRVHGIRHARSVDLSTELVRKRSRLTLRRRSVCARRRSAAAPGRPPGSRGPSARSRGPPPRVGTTVSSGSPRTRASWSPWRPPATCTDPLASRATRSAGSGTTANSTWSRAGPSPRAVPHHSGLCASSSRSALRSRSSNGPVPLCAASAGSSSAPRRAGERAGRDDPELRRGQPRVEVRLGRGKDEADEIGARRVGQRVGDQRSPHGGGAPALDVGEDRRGAERVPSWKRTPVRSRRRHTVRSLDGSAESASPGTLRASSNGPVSSATSGSWTCRATSCSDPVSAYSGSRLAGRSGSAQTSMPPPPGTPPASTAALSSAPPPHPATASTAAADAASCASGRRRVRS